MVRENDASDWSREREFLRQAEELRARIFAAANAVRAGLHSEATSAVPAVNVFESGATLRVIASLSGVDAGEVEVRIEGAWLVLSGRRGAIVLERDARPLQIEVPRGPFERRIRLPSSGAFVVGSTRWSQGLLLLELRRSS